MTKFESSIIIKAPVEKVFDFVTDIENMPKTSPSEMGLELLSWDKGPVKIGQKAKVKAKAGGQVWELEAETTDLVKNEKHCVQQRGGPMKKFVMTKLFEPVDVGTKLTWITEYELPYSVLGKIIDVLKVRKDLEKDQDYSMAKMKELIEKE